MKRKEFLKEMQGLDAAGLQDKARTIAQELMKLRFRKATGQLEQPHRLTLLKKDLARIETKLSAVRDQAGKSRQAETSK